MSNTTPSAAASRVDLAASCFFNALLRECSTLAGWSATRAASARCYH
ncbi:hypothetical protein [Salinicola tamaricis]|nr:hypothetical protein [Salinicola tamaricis]